MVWGEQRGFQKSVTEGRSKIKRKIKKKIKSKRKRKIMTGGKSTRAAGGQVNKP